MRTAERFKEIFGAPPRVTVRAPGRTNLIGEHIDYNGGHVLPIAIGKAVEIAATPRRDGHYRLYSVQFKEMYQGSLSPEKSSDFFWTNYPFGVIHEFAKLGHAFHGMDAVIDGDIPRGSGLSSSAALEVATAWAAQTMMGTTLSRMDIALLGQRAENKFVGVNCGIMDQAISANGQAGHALLLDCNTLEARQVPLDLRGEAAILVAHCGVRRGLSSSAYNQRRGKCDAALEVIRAQTKKALPCLCAATLEDLAVSERAMDDEMARRARHAITEEARVLEATQALAAGDFARMGRLLNASHFSLRNDYDVSCAELDELTDRVRSHPGAFGSRLTGAGFGGCTVSLISAAATGPVIEDLKRHYYAPRKLEPLVFVTGAEDGARVL
jgi:galactokinase